MKSLYESILDDEEDLIQNTDAKYSLNIPDSKDAKRITHMPPKYVGYMYEWKSPLFKSLIDNKNLDLTGLYIYWTKYTGNDLYPYYVVHVKPRIGYTFFHNNFAFFGILSNDIDKKYSAAQAKKLAYQFIQCISEHPAEIIKIILDINNKYTNGKTEQPIYIEDLIDKYK